MTIRPAEPNSPTMVSDFIVKSAESILDRQRSNGSFPPGKNGVYDDNPTPVRTSAHWLITLAKAFEQTDRAEFRKAGNAAVDYLLSEQSRPFGYTFHARSAEGKDKCDGLAGQAAAIRGLCYGGPLIERQDAVRAAKEVFLLHPFDKSLGLWRRREINGDRLPIDRTLNHQISFAAAASHMSESIPEVRERIQVFLNRLRTNMGVCRNGRIQHYIRPSISSMLRHVIYEKTAITLINAFAYWVRRVNDNFDTKELGYHPVNLRGLAILADQFSNHSFWKSDKMRQTLFFIDFENTNEMERFEVLQGSGCPSFDIALAWLNFQYGAISTVKRLLRREIEDKFDFEKGLLNKNAADPDLQAATIYRLAFFPNFKIYSCFS